MVAHLLRGERVTVWLMLWGSGGFGVVVLRMGRRREDTVFHGSKTLGRVSQNLSVHHAVLLLLWKGVYRLRFRRAVRLRQIGGTLGC